MSSLTNRYGQTYEEWWVACNKECQRRTELRINELPSWQWWDAWREDYTVNEAIGIFLLEAPVPQ